MFHVERTGFYYIIGKFSKLAYDITNPPGGCALHSVSVVARQAPLALSNSQR